MGPSEGDIRRNDNFETQAFLQLHNSHHSSNRIWFNLDAPKRFKVGHPRRAQVSELNPVGDPEANSRELSENNEEKAKAQRKATRTSFTREPAGLHTCPSFIASTIEQN